MKILVEHSGIALSSEDVFKENLSKEATDRLAAYLYKGSTEVPSAELSLLCRLIGEHVSTQYLNPEVVRFGN